MSKCRLFMPNKIERVLQDKFGSNGKARAFGQLHYWCTKRPDGFYKVKRPCKHPLYKKGDSWSESLGMGRRELDSNFNELVNHHKSLTAYNKCADKFGGKMFCSYTIRRSNMTYYFMDKEKIGEFIASLIAKIPPSPSLSKPMEGDVVSNAPKIMTFETIRNVQDEQPTRTHPDLPCIQTITSLTGNVPKQVLNSKKEQDKLISQEMVNTWNIHMSDKVIWYPSYAKTLCNVLHEFFKGCLKTFKRYCLTIASADFLTGKAKNSSFKAFLFWAIKPDTIQKILSGAYGVKNFFSFSDPEEKNLEAETEHLRNQIKFIENKISVFEDQAKAHQKNLINELKQSLTPEETSIYRDESDRLFYENYPYDPSDKSRDIAKLRNIFFEGPHRFFDCRLKERLGISDIIVIPQELLDKKKYLEKELDKKSKRLNEVRLEKRGLTGLFPCKL